MLFPGFVIIHNAVVKDRLNSPVKQVLHLCYEYQPLTVFDGVC